MNHESKKPEKIEQQGMGKYPTTPSSALPVYICIVSLFLPQPNFVSSLVPGMVL